MNEGSFRVKDVFHIEGRGTIVAGTVESGDLNLGMVTHLSTSEVSIRGFEMFNKKVDESHTGDNVALLLAGENVSKELLMQYKNQTIQFSKSNEGLRAQQPTQPPVTKKKGGLFNNLFTDIFKR